MTAPTPEQTTAVLIALTAQVCAAVAWCVGAASLLRTRRAPPVLQGDAATPGWLVAWHALGLMALLPTPAAWAEAQTPAIVVMRAWGGALCACAGAWLLAWEAAVRMRYADRSVAVTVRERFLTYGPYARVRRPQELAILLLVCGTAFVLPGWWRPAIAMGVFGASMAVRARRIDDAIARAAGEEYARYQSVTALLLPGSSPKNPTTV